MQKVQIVEILHLRKLPIAINSSYVIIFLTLQWYLKRIIFNVLYIHTMSRLLIIYETIVFNRINWLKLT